MIAINTKITAESYYFFPVRKEHFLFFVFVFPEVLSTVFTIILLGFGVLPIRERSYTIMCAAPKQ